jgi:hypothetical protein
MWAWGELPPGAVGAVLSQTDATLGSSTDTTLGAQRTSCRAVLERPHARRRF